MNSLLQSALLVQFFTIVILTIYPFVQRGGDTFEMKIVVSIGIRYVFPMLLFFDDSVVTNRNLKNFIYILLIESKVFSHWLYATMYLKTCVLVPGFKKKANLLLRQEQGNIGSEIEIAGMSSDFIEIIQEIDTIV